MSKTKIQTLCRIASMAALLCLCSWITVPTAVPFTLQTFAVFCSLLLLGGKKSIAAIGLYVLLGAIGLPVFSGFRGGIGHLLGPTGGYIIGFLVTALSYLLLEPLTVRHRSLCVPVLIFGLFLCYLCGTVWYRAVGGLNGADDSFAAVAAACVWPYVLPDLLKLLLARVVCRRVRRHLGTPEQPAF